jgi:predicted RNase H-like HicB family nuclease
MNYYHNYLVMQEANLYPVILFWSEEDAAFIAEVPDLPGCLADGVTQAEALSNVAIIINEWLDMARELGRPIPAPRRRLQLAA